MPNSPHHTYIQELHAWLASGKARQLREAHGMSLTDVSHELEVSAQAIQRWETGVRVPRGRNARIYHQFLSKLAATGTTPKASPES